MPLIIAATDFSDIATNAVHYACGLAQQQQADLVILHSYTVPLMFNDGPMPVNFVNDTQHDAEDHMEPLLSALAATYPTLNITGSTSFGDILDAIEDCAKNHGKPWMIIVGNSTMGENGTWPGSTVIEAFNNLKYPVLAIPPHTTYKPLHNLGFAFDNKHSGNIPAMLHLAGITEALSATLHVLFAHTGGDTDTEIDPTVRNLLAPANPQYHTVADTDIQHAIATFVQGSSIDMLIMIPRHHSFFEGLFHKSHTKAVTHSIQVPVLALHDTQ